MKQRSSSRTPQALRDIRSMNVVAIHPQDQDGDELLAQLRRIGCKVQMVWPAQDSLPEATDIVFLAVRPETLCTTLPWLDARGAPPVIPVVAYENPIIIEAVMQLGAYCVVPSPVRSFGLLTAIAVTLNQHRNRQTMERYVRRVEEKLAEQRQIQRAKTILMETRSLSERDAYELLRSQAMTKREPIESIADAIIKAHEVLGFR
ncbi:ANTAR domain-containing response regulator [Paraburkholderia caballeronis]|uniref:Two-component response regulator, AmiR/NasT family, consists of REC and RNA-binding antiterminator (ANTAR) domains n=1 Tax=Paraburkholderia caballeronis TaxID=416943 RepID=A0A1H7G749_9BURK|nr:ANTAR domain-containing protein [Paraburkholderia caballeronis]PXW24729.1 AmiR/NasT family two-component response regulator [Paraburkholderia caballeronis]PXX00459.1 AmiR/NasT family two-component response regulator [Paraburkholderia caballeronis]RAJ98522.1 AmiR/NasT family two-component response regulator [Paraburkholderia caballeronis]TDV16657.1 AmiR/NasT family two-component response regulator [Paraburkholderia caballeronis]TDV19053.1 AmiR/NasT family two-component response regulator [Pa